MLGSRAQVGTLGLSTHTNRATTFKPASRFKGLATRHLVTRMTFHGVASSPLLVTPVYVGLGFTSCVPYLCVVKAFPQGQNIPTSSRQQHACHFATFWAGWVAWSCWRIGVALAVGTGPRRARAGTCLCSIPPRPRVFSSRVLIIGPDCQIASTVALVSARAAASSRDYPPFRSAGLLGSLALAGRTRLGTLATAVAGQLPSVGRSFSDMANFLVRAHLAHPIGTKMAQHRARRATHGPN